MTDRKSVNLTPARIAAAKPRARAWVLWDAKARGFGVRVFPGGGKAYVIKYRTHGKQRWFTIARVGELGLADARDRAGRALADIRDGADPARERQERRQAPTVAEGLDRFFAETVPARIEKGLMGERTATDYRRQAGLTVRPSLGALKIESVTKRDIEVAVAPRAPVQRNRTLGFLSRLFAEFERWEWRAQGSNPVRGIERTREQPRDRTFSPDEIQSFAKALAEEQHSTGAAVIRFLMLTGWRTAEARNLQWTDVDLGAGQATLRTSKTGRQVRPVAASALQVIASQPRTEDNPHVFAGEDGKAVDYHVVRKVFRRICEAAGIADARMHDLRRTLATRAAADPRISVFLLRDMLGHKTLHMANRYARQAGSELQAAQDATAEAMAALMKGEGGEVVPLKRPVDKGVAAG